MLDGRIEKIRLTNMSLDVRLVCEEKFLLCHKTIEQPLLKPGDYLFAFLALQHH